MESSKELNLNFFVDESNFYNDLVLGSLVPARLWKPLPHFFQIWLRNFFGVVLLYLTISSLWSYYIYRWKRNVYVPEDKIPTKKTMIWHICVAMKGMPLYSLVPSISEYMIANGFTRCFSRISDVGLVAYLAYCLVYLLLVDFGIYALHRMFHVIRPLYKYLHATHHNFNKESLLSPFAGMALNPVDGVLQSLPHEIALFLVPVHFTTHLVLLFVEIIWTTNIHDCVALNTWPFMGSSFHKIHHCTSKNNYGHYTVLMDWLFGTLCHPTEEEFKKAT